MGTKPRKQPGDRAADAAGASRHHHDLTFKDIGREDSRMAHKLRVGQAGFRLRLGIIHERPCPEMVRR